MADGSLIHWLHDPYLDRAGATWSVWYGCTRESTECLNCYISRQPPLRMRHLRFDKAAIGGATEIVMAPRHLLFQPLRWHAPRMIFPNSLSDWWHGAVHIRHTAEMYAVMLLTPQHVYPALTKRHRRQRNWLNSPRFTREVMAALDGVITEYQALGGRIPPDVIRCAREHLDRSGPNRPIDPAPNLWIGVTAGSNATAAARIPALNGTPAAVRWLSCEPIPDPGLDLDLHLGSPCHTCHRGVTMALVPDGDPDFCDTGCDGGFNFLRPDWTVFGGESGPPAKATPLDTTPAVGLRPVDPEHLEFLTGQAAAAGARVFVKQLGEPWAKANGARDRKGGDPDEWPATLRIREYPLALARRALVYDPGNALALQHLEARGLTHAAA